MSITDHMKEIRLLFVLIWAMLFSINIVNWYYSGSLFSLFLAGATFGVMFEKLLSMNHENYKGDLIKRLFKNWGEVSERNDLLNKKLLKRKK